MLTVRGPQYSACNYTIFAIQSIGQYIKHVNEPTFLGIYLDTHLTVAIIV